MPRKTASAALRVQRGRPATRREASQATSAQPIAPRATTRFENSISACPPFSGNGVSPQRGQLSQPSVGRRQAHDRAGHDDEVERRQGQQGEPKEARRAHLPSARRASSETTARVYARSVDEHARSRLDRADPAQEEAARGEGRLSTAPFSAGNETSRPPAVWGVVAERGGSSRDRARGRAGRRTRGCAGRRRCAPRRPRASTRRRAPERAGVESQRDRPVGHLVRARRRPKPVTSVTAFGENGRSVGGGAVQLLHQPDRRSLSTPPGPAPRAPHGGRGRCRAASSGTARRRGAPAFGQIASGWTVPTTASPYFGSTSRDRVPAREQGARREHALGGSGEDGPEHLGRQALRKVAIESAKRHAAHREHVVERVHRRDRAEVPRVVHDRRKKSRVKTSARSSSSR